MQPDKVFIYAPIYDNTSPRVIQNQVSDLREFEAADLSKPLSDKNLQQHEETLSHVKIVTKDPDSPKINVLKSVAKKQI